MIERGARTYLQTRSTMQAGLAGTLYWIPEYPFEEPREPNPFMGWTSARDTKRQIHLRFETLQQALKYVQRHAPDTDIERPQTAQLVVRNYASNFVYDREVSGVRAVTL